MTTRADTPRWVAAILSWPRLWPLARLALVSAYLVGGFTKLFDFDGAIAEQEHFGLYPGSGRVLSSLSNSSARRWWWPTAGSGSARVG
jgi:uncharacterized membrane protein YphA (DoxX/SURF4 family)